MSGIRTAAFAAFHLAVPLYCITSFGASPAWLIGSLAFLLAAAISARSIDRGWPLVALGLASGLNAFLNLALGASWYMQGAAFNEAYFIHVGWETVKVATSAYTGVFALAMGYLVAGFFAPLLLVRPASPRAIGPVAAAALWAVALVINYPVVALATYVMAPEQVAGATIPELPGELQAALARRSSGPQEPAVEAAPAEAAGAPVKAPASKNIVLVYAEGLEQLYMDREIFGDIVPRIREIAGRSHRFSNVFQVRGATTTVAGIVASQCGFPLLVSTHLAGNSTMTAFDRPFEGERCMADFLAERGYRTVYLGGAPLAFAGKGNFLRTHGYQKVLGYHELVDRLPDPSYGMGWGLHDDSLFDLAVEELRQLEASDEPYLLTVLTIGTHHPDGHVAASCDPLEGSDDTMLQAIYCGDQLISRFIGEVQRITDPSETLTVVFSDHLALRNSLWETLQKHKSQRRLTWFVLDGGGPVVDDRPAVHFDMGPTVLSMAGHADIDRIGLGRSMSAEDLQRAEEEVVRYDPSGLPDLGSPGSVTESGFRIDYAQREIAVGDWSARASANGWPFTSGLFMLILGEDGRVVDTLFSADFAQVIGELSGRMVVGISIQAEGSEFEDQFFFGRLSEDLTKLRVAPLTGDVQAPPSVLGFALQ